MKRRDFLRTAIPAGVVLPALINGFTFEAFGSSSPLAALASAVDDNDHVLVLVQMTGGNDGLNMVVPLDQFDNLANARANILLPKSKILALDGIQNTGLHPAMTGLQSMYNDGKLKIVQSVGYPSPNFSHFRATDIWLTASDSATVLNSGWAGRYLGQEYPNYPVGYPNTTMPDPLAIQIGSTVSTALQGPAVNMGLAISDPTNFYNLINGIQDTAPNTNAGKELTYIRQVSQQTQQYGTVIKNAAAKITKQGTYPTGNSLADQLKIVARLIAGGLKTRVYMVSIGSFDTHATQVVAGATETGTHATLLQKLSDGIKAFTDDLKGLGASKRVVGMTFSEFGRRIKSNANSGTDHGAAAPLFVFGDNADSGILGISPIIGTNVGVNDNIPMQYDFRSVYASLLSSWFCVPDAMLTNVMLKDFQKLSVIKASAASGCTAGPANSTAGINVITNYPNPFQGSTTINYQSQGGHTLVQIFNNQGKLMTTLVDAETTEGSYNVTFQSKSYPIGTYYARLQNGPIQQVRTMMLMAG